jgi:hypothetical protein
MAYRWHKMDGDFFTTTNATKNNKHNKRLFHEMFFMIVHPVNVVNVALISKFVLLET